MTKIDALRRILLPCFALPTTTTNPITTTTTTKKRLSTSLRDDIQETNHNQESEYSPTTTDSPATTTSQSLAAPPRPSRTMVIGTIFGHRRGTHIWFCIQHDRLTTKPTLLLQLALPTHQLVKEMRCGLVRLALECHHRPGTELSSCPLHSVPLWTLFCNGRKLGFAVRRKPNEKIRSVLKTMQSMTVGAGCIPSGSETGFGSEEEGGGELMYMRANYEFVVGSADSESFHLINQDECPGQELSVFLLRSR